VGGKDGAAVGAGRCRGVGHACSAAKVELMVTAAGAAGDCRSAARGAVREAVNTYAGYIHPRGGVVFKFFRLCRLHDLSSYVRGSTGVAGT